MDAKKLLLEKPSIVHQQHLDGVLLEVKETTQYKWFEYGGVSIQSLMSKAEPEKIMMPVSQSLLLFLLLTEGALNVLNLGLGGAALERILVKVPNLSLSSIDGSQAIIDMAKCHFSLPEKVQVYCQQAELFIQHSTIQYDVILCDLFIGEKSPDFLFSNDFYQQLANITNNNAVVSINLQADTNQQLLLALLAIKQHFPHIALIEFNDYSNIVIICSRSELPTKILLQQRLADFSLFDMSFLDKVINNMLYIPYAK